MWQSRVKIRTACAAVLTAVLVLSACGAQPGQRSSSLTLTAITPPPSFDVKAGPSNAALYYFEPVYDKLLEQGLNSELEPWLATQWEYNADRTQLTLTLRDDVTFTDGTKLDASAVVASLERYRDGTAPDAGALSGKQFAVQDATNVVIKLEAPDPSLLDSLSGAPGFIQAPSMADDPKSDVHPVGSGPYVLDIKSTVVGTTYKYTANRDYWNPDAIQYDALTINISTDPNATVNAIKAGETDAAVFTDTKSLSAVLHDGWRLEGSDYGFHGLLLYDRDGAIAPELADRRVRRAINMAFDRELLADALMDGKATPTAQILPARSPGFDKSLNDANGYNPDAARRLLAEAGYPNGFTLTIPTIPLLQTALDLMSQQLEDVGITVKFAPTSNYVPELRAGKYPVGFGIWPQRSDYDVISTLVASGASQNPFHSQDRVVDDYINTIQQGAAGDAKVDEALKELNRYLVEQAWFAPLFVAPRLMVVNDRTEISNWHEGYYFPAMLAFKPKG